MIDAFTHIIESHEGYMVARAWEKFGGSFTKGLAEALNHADPINIHKIKKAFPKEWEQGLEQYEKYMKGETK